MAAAQNISVGGRNPGDQNGVREPGGRRDCCGGIAEQGAGEVIDTGWGVQKSLQGARTGVLETGYQGSIGTSRGRKTLALGSL